jgi:hypothetical protein
MVDQVVALALHLAVALETLHQPTHHKETMAVMRLLTQVVVVAVLVKRGVMRLGQRPETVATELPHLLQALALHGPGVVALALVLGLLVLEARVVVEMVAQMRLAPTELRTRAVAEVAAVTQL